MSPQTINQILVLIGVISCSISDGFIFGQMSGMLEGLQGANGTNAFTQDHISWIASTINVTCVCGFIIGSIATDYFGRRYVIAALSAPIVVNWVVVYYAQEAITLIITRIIVGVCFGAVLELSFIVTSEYTSPNVRGLCLNLISAVGPSVGTAFGHVLSILLHWRTVALVGLIPSGLAALIPCFWKESPPWLAAKGRFEECETSFRALHVRSEASEKELQSLIKTERRIISLEPYNNFSIRKLWRILRRRDVWHILEFSAVMSVYRTAGGKILFSTFALTIFQNVTGKKADILQVTLLIDGFAILGSCLSCVLISSMKMRTLFFSTAMIANMFLFSLSACIYFAPNNYIFSWITAVLLALYFICINSGPYPVVEALIGEIFPIDIKSFCVIFFGFISSVPMFLSTKFAPEMFTGIGYHGVFLLNACLMLLCYIYFWWRMPETKGKTLVEIWHYFEHNSFDFLRHKEDSDRAMM